MKHMFYFSLLKTTIKVILIAFNRIMDIEATIDIKTPTLFLFSHNEIKKEIGVEYAIKIRQRNSI